MAPTGFNYIAFVTALYRKHLPLDVRLDLQQWFTLIDSRRRGPFGRSDPRWGSAQPRRAEARGEATRADRIDHLTGAVGCAVCLLTPGRAGHRSPLLEDMLADEFATTRYDSMPLGKHTLFSFEAINDDRITYQCGLCKALVRLAPPRKYIPDMSQHPHPINHFVWREGGAGVHGSAWLGPGTFLKGKGKRPRSQYYQCSVHGTMPEYRQKKRQKREETQGRKTKTASCSGRLCDLKRVGNYWTWKAFVRYLLTDVHVSRTLARFYRATVLRSAVNIQRTFRGHCVRRRAPAAIAYRRARPVLELVRPFASAELVAMILEDARQSVR